MRVVLFQSVANLGMAGEIVDVKPGYYRNFLEPRGLALQETPSALRLLASKKKKIEQILLKEKSQAETAKSAIGALTLSFLLKAGEKGRLFGSVTNKDIAESLKSRGVEVDRHKIELPEAIKTVGKHVARIRLHPEVVAELSILVEREQKAAPEAAAQQTTPSAEASSTDAAPSGSPESASPIPPADSTPSA